MRHQTHHCTGRITDTGDVVDRSVRVAAAVAQRDLAGGGQRRRIRVHVPTLAVGDRGVDRVGDAAGPDAHRRRHRSEFHPAAVERATPVVTECSGEQTGPRQHLEPVADPDQRVAGIDERSELVGQPDGEVEGEHAPRAEGVGVAESARHHGEARLGQPRRSCDQFRRQHDLDVGADEFECVAGVRVAVRSGPRDHDGRDAGHADPPASPPRPV